MYQPTSFVTLAAIAWMLSTMIPPATGHPYVGFDPGNEVYTRVEKIQSGHGASAYPLKLEVERETVVWSGGVLLVETASELGGRWKVEQLTDGKDLVIRIQLQDEKGTRKVCAKNEQAIEVLQEYRGFGIRSAFPKRENSSSWLKEEIEVGSKDFADFQKRTQAYKVLEDWKTEKHCAGYQGMVEQVVEDGIDNGEGEGEHELNTPQRKSRSRRAISFVMPGTTWCGMGNVSSSNADANGAHAESDQCCRRHDLCDHTISAFSTKYYMFNFRLHTISHCECDDRFRTCLRMSNTEHADTVGRLFFNMMSIKCFVFEPIQVCGERNWWGKCLRYHTDFKASLRDPTTY